MMGMPLMKCGHVAMSTCSADGKGNTFNPPIPSCVICSCMEIDTNAPDLTGRKARCTYFGKSGFRNSGPIYGGGKCSNRADEGGCQCEVQSSFDLPFFAYTGPGSNHYSVVKSGPQPFDEFFCGCAGWD